jgi:hypothetical protein
MSKFRSALRAPHGRRQFENVRRTGEHRLTFAENG